MHPKSRHLQREDLKAQIISAAVTWKREVDRDFGEKTVDFGELTDDEKYLYRTVDRYLTLREEWEKTR